MLPGHSPHASRFGSPSLDATTSQQGPHELIKTGIIPPAMISSSTTTKPAASPVPAQLKSMTTCTNTTVHYAYDNESSSSALMSTTPLSALPPPPPVVPAAQPRPEAFIGREASYLSRVGDEQVRRLSSSGGALAASPDYRA